jgi:membrane protease YdiL (CAAX protease family)
MVWPLLFKESPFDLGLRFRGLREHAWIYVLCIVIIIPVLFVVSYAPDFQAYYPMYPHAGRSWVDFLAWEVIYLGQFLTLEVFFRGFFLRGARSLGASAIFAMCVPYVMIHFPKPYLEACGALVAGIVLGSLSMQTGSIWAGFLVHSTVAVLMDVLALQRRGTLPNRLTPTSAPTPTFQSVDWILWVTWAMAIAVLAFLFYHRRRQHIPLAPKARSHRRRASR